MNNTLIIKECLQEFISENDLKIPEDDAFELYALSLLNKQTNLSVDDFNGAIVDGSKDGGIDVFLLSVDEIIINSDDVLEEIKLNNSSTLKVTIGQSKNTEKFTEATLDKIFISIDTILNLDTNEVALDEAFNNQLVEKIIWFRDLWKEAIKKGAKISLGIYYACVSNEINESEAFVLKKEKIIKKAQESIINASVYFNLYSAAELLKLHSQRTEVSLELAFKEQPSTIEYEQENIGYIGVVKLPDYHAFITDDQQQIRESIFEENVRHYQGEVDVNKKISESLKTDFETDFWWMNNGITIIAEDVRPFHKTLQLEGVQIVNGLQTSFTIAKHYEKKNDDSRSVLVKIIKSSDKETIDKIISATNRQTPVNPALLRATDDTQRKLEIFFEQNGYFYDRRKNYYKNQGKPISKIFSIQATAQAIHAIINRKPSEARAKPTTLIKTKESYEKIFDQSIGFEAYLNCCLIFRSLETLLKTSAFEKEKRSLVRMFLYHLARISMSLVSQKSHPSIQDIIGCNLDLIDQSVFESSIDFLMNSIKQFVDESETKSHTSISKSGPFEEKITQMLIDELNPNDKTS